MYTEKTIFSELLKKEEVTLFLQKMAPHILEPQARDYIAGFTMEQIKGIMPPEQHVILEALIDVANGKEPSVQLVDPHTVPATIKVGVMSEGYNIDDIDGAVYMLDHDFSGCIVMQFSKKMREDQTGTITYSGEKMKYVLKKVRAAGDAQMLGVFVRDICTEYDHEYVLHFEGFVDEDGLMIDPTDVKFITDARAEYNPDYSDNDKVALQAAQEGIVLLKNKGVLPLQAKEIFVLGGREFRITAVGAGKINPRYVVGLNEAMKENGLEVSQDADTALMVISRPSGENYDNNACKGEFYLSDEEEQNIIALKNKYKKVIAVINSGYPMDVRWIDTYDVDAVIWCGFSGMFGGRALVDILTGKVNPSGKLPDTWSNDYWDIPASKNFYQPKTPEQALDADHDVWVDTCYEEDIYVGYRYFETFHKAVAYPFGFGLSYTSFSVNAELLTHSMEEEEIVFTVEVENTGLAAGKEVVQVYAQIPDGVLEQPAKRLIAFDKTELLQPGEKGKVVLAVPKSHLTSYDEGCASWILEEGKYQFYVGTSVKEVKPAGELELTERAVYRKTVNRVRPDIDFKRLSKYSDDFPQGVHSGIKENVYELLPKCTRMHIEECNVPDISEADDWSVEEMARLSVCASAGWGMHQKGEAGKIFRIEGKDLPYYACADGNSGVNVNRKNIGMPSSNMVCASWNVNLAYQVGKTIAKEAKDNDIQMILAPAMNIHRNPLCGRHPEYFSEDPLLAGMMAGNQCRGLEEEGISASVKHVACNNSEASRKRNQSIVSERALREIYLKAFEIALEIHKPDSIMTGYNALNGVFTAEDEELIQGIFREEFGFDGFVMTDWNSYDTADIPAAVQAGNCWMTPGSEDNTYVDKIVDGVRKGIIDEKRLRNNVKYMLNVIRKRT